jgi:hypothetical protein
VSDTGRGCGQSALVRKARLRCESSRLLPLFSFISLLDFSDQAYFVLVPCSQAPSRTSSRVIASLPNTPIDLGGIVDPPRYGRLLRNGTRLAGAMDNGTANAMGVRPSPPLSSDPSAFPVSFHHVLSTRILSAHNRIISGIHTKTTTLSAAPPPSRAMDTSTSPPKAAATTASSRPQNSGTWT